MSSSVRKIHSIADVSSSSDGSSSDSESKARAKTGHKKIKPILKISFRCRPKNTEENPCEDQLFFLDAAGGDSFDAARAKNLEIPTKTSERDLLWCNQKIDAKSEVAKMLANAVIKPDFEKLSVEEANRKSNTRLKRDRKIERERTKGKGWSDMPATELTDERRHDLELIQMRDALDPKTHYRRADRDVLPKYFEVGKIVEGKADYYSSRMTKKERKRTIAEELMNDHELIAKNRRRYEEIMKTKALTRRGAFQKRGFISKRSQRKKQGTKK
uniref:Fcf2 pre-rRNA processing C-terminal domain-containing protein n=1 Tax=Ditylenchus dipsaci TaxID=166011 RepID=A0A915EFF7_9BILA